MRKIPPCKDCPDREQFCHGSCQQYKEWKAEIDEGNRLRAEHKKIVGITHSPRAEKNMNRKMKERR